MTVWITYTRKYSMPKHIGSTSGFIDWDSVIPLCNINGDHNTVTSVVDRSEAEAENELLSSYRGIIDTWQAANYTLSDIEWYDYYPGEHFPIEVQEAFGKLVNASPLRVFVSQVDPGRNVPYHWDVEDNEQEWLSQYGNLVRYVCFIDKPQFGHVLILEDECFYNVAQHEVYEWNNYRSFHAGTNCGSTPYYLFHFLGYKND